MTDIFYELPAAELVEGLSTADGQEVISVAFDGDSVLCEVYTPRRDNPDIDDDNRACSETRISSRENMIELAVFADTEADLSRHPKACNRREVST